MKLHAKRPKSGAARLKWYRAKRRKAGKDDPNPLEVVVGGAMGVTARRDKSVTILREHLMLGADVLGMTECSDFNGQAEADRIFGEGKWTILQMGRPGSPESGSLLALNAKRTRVEDVKFKQGSPKGKNVRARWIVRALVTIDPGTPAAWTGWFAVGHAPLKSTGRQPGFLRKFSGQHAWIYLGDLNTRRPTVRRLFPKFKLRGVGVLWAAVPNWMPVSDADRVAGRDLGGHDHDAVLITLWKNKNKVAP